MSDDERLGVYYIKKTKTLLLGMPKEQLLATQNPFMVAYLPFKEIVKTARLKLSDIDEISLTTSDNFHDIARSFDEEAKLWDEFLEWKESKSKADGQSKGDIIQLKMDRSKGGKHGLDKLE